MLFRSGVSCVDNIHLTSSPLQEHPNPAEEDKPMKKTITQRKIFIPLIMLGICVVICLVEALSRYLSIPTAPKEFPKGNIVFQEYVWDEDKYTIGFVNDDGSDVEHVYMPLDKFLLGDGVTPMNPIISQDGTMMVFEIFGSAYNTKRVVILLAGKRPQKCELLFGELSGPTQLIHHDAHILIDAVSPPGVMLVYDLANCKDSEQAINLVYNEDNYVAVYNEDNLGLPAYQGALSPDGKELAISTIFNESELFSIVVFDLATKEYRFIDSGSNPSFSPDGEWVAYTGVDGIYIARNDGTDNRRIVYYENPEFVGGDWISGMDWPTKPAWSPDGNWIVYHKCVINEPQSDCMNLEDFVIFKVNVHTGEEVKIIEGGLNPYWRP